ncbi:MAG: CDP-alcohol phosphatidyltransferase family protein [Proteobacteria bacterium]|nr:CDP-alcohol phosphatidyltransferase family protein [Pseudomonadota bacterium]
MNLPNFLSLIRILFIPLLVILLIYEYYDLSLIVLVLSAISDALDGFIARFFHQKTTLGAYLDPIADKLLLVTSYITLSILNIIPDWLTIIVISRDVIISLGVLILLINAYPLEIKPSGISKLTTLFQLLTLFLSLSYNHLGLKLTYLQIQYAITATLTIASGLHYLYRGIKIINSDA